MKIDTVVIGKRVTIGAAINSTAAALAFQWPDKAPLFVAMAVPLTVIVQIWVAHKYGVTT